MTAARLAIFDLDNTLVDRDDAFQRWADEFAAAHELPPDAREWLIAADCGGFVPKEIFFGRVREHFALDTTAGALWAAYRRRMPELVTCRPAVLAALARLRAAGWTIAVATNGATETQVGKLRRTGLDRHVDGWAISGEIGVRKPDPAIFAAAAKAAGSDIAGGGWVVGDSPTLDVDGGRAAGLRAIWVRRGGSWPAGLAPPERVVDDVGAAVGALLG